MPAVKGVRSIEMDVADVGRAARFYANVWGLAEVENHAGTRYFRGTGRYHHILALHPAKGAPAFRRIVFDGGDRARLDAIWHQVAKQLGTIDEPGKLSGPGGGYGFGFKDAEGRNLAVVCDVADHRDDADVPDRPRKVAHVNINSAGHPACVRFFCEALGFRVIDETGGLLFMNCDSTDHNSMVISKDGRSTVNHVAFEMSDLDSVMRGAGRMKDNGYPIEWGVGRHGAGNNVFAYFAGPEEFPIEMTGEVLQIDGSYVPHGPDYWKFPPGRADQWGVTAPHSARWKRIQDMFGFTANGPIIPS
jgi:catechol 2,3-dioxygenase-like lactoylglutathione lyase family enzyme